MNIYYQLQTLQIRASTLVIMIISFIRSYTHLCPCHQSYLDRINKDRIIIQHMYNTSISTNVEI